MVAAKIQHCPISSKFDIWVDNDVPNWFPTLKKFYRSPFSKWPPRYRKISALYDFNAISYMWVDYDVPNWFLTSKHFYRSQFSKWPPQYHTHSTLSDFNDISYVGRLWCPEMIPDIEKCLPVAIFKMATTQIQHCSISKVTFNLFFKLFVCGRFGRLHNC